MRSHQRSRRSSSSTSASRHRNRRHQGESAPNHHHQEGQQVDHRYQSGNEMTKSDRSDKKWILLNVGGTYFLTGRSTLMRLTANNSPLFRLASSSTNVLFDRDDRGAYLIDRDPAYFSVVLNYLRHGHLLLTRDTTEEGVLIEAEFFVIPELYRQLKQRIQARSLNYL